MDARADNPPLTDLVRATLFVVVDEGVGERGPLVADAVGRSVDARRPLAGPTGGFLVAVDMSVVTE